MTLTDRIFGFGSGLATSSDSVERVPQGQGGQYTRLTVRAYS